MFKLTDEQKEIISLKFIDGLSNKEIAEINGKKEDANQMLKKVGTLGANGAKKWFTDPRNGWRQNSPETIRRKLSKLTGKRLRKALNVLNSVSENMPLVGMSALDKINTPLIDTGQMRRAITHVEELI